MSYNNLLEKILYKTYNFCCLCHKSVENENFYSISDKVYLDSKHTQNLSQILSFVLRDLVSGNITDTFGLICHYCTEKLLESYKFIKKCQENVIKFYNIILALEKYFTDNDESDKIRPLYYVSLNKYTVNIDLYNENYHNERFGIQIKQKYDLDDWECNEKYLNYENPVEFEIGQDISLPVNKQEVQQRKEYAIKNDDIRDKTDLTVYRCKICKNIYSRGPNLKKHYLSVHAPKQHKCSVCFKSFGSALLLKTHKKHLHSKAALCCTTCGKTYNTIYALQNHEKRHKIRLVCQHCGKMYKTKRAFKSHIDQVHNSQSDRVVPKFICDYCGITYSQKSGLRVHIQFKHGNGKYYECEWCKKKFCFLSHLKEHVSTHTKDKKFSCKFCDGRFSTKMTLLYHIRRHTGEKPFNCDHCDNRFISASERKNHIRRHHLPPLQCDICSKEFKLNNCLVRHRLKHFDSRSKLYQVL